ncbi:MAG: biotin/lipoyl-binding protein [Candidatus Rokubacteria bacterium]|nr:biotin/lipoyl-binding protein [Candidatus Rokubacteria bacterium]
MKFITTVEGRALPVEVTGGDGRYRVVIGTEVWVVDARLAPQGIASLLVGGISYVADVTDHDGACVVDVEGETYVIDVEEETRHIIRTRGGAAGASGGQVLKAPMPGRITHVAVTPGSRVNQGDALVVIEAMKMQNEFKAGVTGTVKEVRVEAGQAVNPGDVLVVIEADP